LLFISFPSDCRRTWPYPGYFKEEREYGEVLVSDAMHSLLSLGIRSECRLVDYVRIWDFPQELRLYCLDLDDFSVRQPRRVLAGGVTVGISPG